MNITDAERNDEQFIERVSIAIEDGQQTEDAAIYLARIEKRNRDRLKSAPKQKSLSWRG
jgi:hypothetical protein